MQRRRAPGSEQVWGTITLPRSRGGTDVRRGSSCELALLRIVSESVSGGTQPRRLRAKTVTRGDVRTFDEQRSLRECRPRRHNRKLAIHQCAQCLRSAGRREAARRRLSAGRAREQGIVRSAAGSGTATKQAAGSPPGPDNGMRRPRRGRRGTCATRTRSWALSRLAGDGRTSRATPIHKRALPNCKREERVRTDHERAARDRPARRRDTLQRERAGTRGARDGVQRRGTIAAASAR
jgi:hypothetical protein